MIEIRSELPEVTKAHRELIVCAVETALRDAGAHGGVCVLVTDEHEIRALNSAYRGVDRATDVLTFPAWEGDAILSPPDGYLGDIAVCFARAQEQAAEYGHSLDRELAFLAVHGALHLLGYDHAEPEEEEKMCRKQEQILGKMGLNR